MAISSKLHLMGYLLPGSCFLNFGAEDQTYQSILCVLSQKDCICRSSKSCLKLVTPIIGILLNFFMYEFSIYFVERKTVYKCINLMSPNLLLIRSRRGCAQIQWLTRSTGAGNRCSRQLSSCQLPSTCRPPKLAFCLPWQVCSHPGSMKRGRDH